MSPQPRFTAAQGQYLAFIHSYGLIHDIAPAEGPGDTSAPPHGREAGRGPA